MKKIVFLFSFLFFASVVVAAPWRGRFFFDEKTSCIYGVEVNALGQNVTRHACPDKKGKSNEHQRAS